MLVVLDTNVLVAGLLNPFGAPGRIVDLVFGGILQVAFDDRIIAEYFEVLARPAFRLPDAMVHDVLSHIQTSGIHILAPPLSLPAIPDPDDLPFIEVALGSGARFLVTGNPRHFPLAEFPAIAVVAPAEFLAAVGGAL